MLSFWRSSSFWCGATAAFLVAGGIFAWELHLLSPWIPGPPRFPPTTTEYLFGTLLTLLVALNVGLFCWRRQRGSCPRGTGQATGTAGTVGLIALLCPACLLLPASILGISISLAVLAPFVPLLQLIAIILLLASTWMLLRPHAHTQTVS